MKHCTRCPRHCQVDRENGAIGFCGAGRLPRVARAAPHLWEEPCLVGQGGSGTVFFSGCPLRCVFCQNQSISREGVGYAVTVEKLSDIFLSLGEQGVANLNLVTPTPWVEEIKAALTLAWDKGFWLPTVYNTSGYEEPAVIDGLAGYISVYLPDFKYMDAALGARLSGVSDYPEVAKRSLDRMVHQRGTPHINAEGLMTRGVIVRHLVLPGHVDDSKRVIAYLHETYGDEIYLSLMSQYTPMPGMTGELARTLSAEEYEEVVDFARTIGVTQAFLQEGGAASESFIPAFNGEGVI